MRKKNLGFTLIEVLIAMAMGITVMSGVVSVLVVSKSNYISERELAGVQENARFAIKYLSDEIRMAGYTGCSSAPLNSANSINITSGNSWYLDGTGIEGFDQFSTEANRSTFPASFNADVAMYTDAIVIRRGEQEGLRIDGNHNPNSANIPLNKQHAYHPGDIMVISSPDCQQVGVFQVSGPTNNNNNAQNIVHNTGSMSPGNCTKNLGGNFDCNSVGNSVATPYPPGSSVMHMKSEAYYVGTSAVGNGIPALFREKLVLDASTDTATTVSEELVQGVENMQILYGVDNSGADGLADIYMEADNAAMDWDKVVSVRLSLRMRSVDTVYSDNVAYGDFMGVSGTSGSDPYMRQTVTTTIQLRNR